MLKRNLFLLLFVYISHNKFSNFLLLYWEKNSIYLSLLFHDCLIFLTINQLITKLFHDFSLILLTINQLITYEVFILNVLVIYY